MHQPNHPPTPQPGPADSVRPTIMLLIGVVTVMLLAVLWIVKMSLSRPAPEPATVEAAAPEPAPEATAPAPKPGPISAPVRRTVAKKSTPAPRPTTLEDHWGIQVAGVRLSMANSIVDLRYKVLDPAKAAHLGDGKTPAYIIDHATGKKLIMPTPPKEGAFPPTSHQLIAGKTYFSMVSNQGGALKSGSQVTVVIGGSEATDLTLE